jgi:hypothetical protein
MCVYISVFVNCKLRVVYVHTYMWRGGVSQLFLVDLIDQIVIHR